MQTLSTASSRALALILAASVLEGCGGSVTGQARGAGASAAAIPITSTTVQRISVQRKVDLSGTLVSFDQAKVSSEVAGRVRDVVVRLGTDVQAGDVLVELDSHELRLASDRAESALRQTEAQLGINSPRQGAPLPADEQIASIQQATANRDDAQKAFARAQQLRGRGLLPQVDYDGSETRLKVMEANYRTALDTVHSLKAALQDRAAAYELAQKKVADAKIKAPVSGTIAERLVQPGEYIREGTPVVTIVQMTPLELRTAIQEKLAAFIHPGQRVEFFVEAYPNRVFDAEVQYVGPSVDQGTRTFSIEARVDNKERLLKPGFFAKGTVTIRRDDNVMAVPDDAVSTMAGVATVFVVGDGKVKREPVTLGVRQGNLWEVAGGLKGSETLAASNLVQLATGKSVRVTGTRVPSAAPADQKPE